MLGEFKCDQHVFVHLFRKDLLFEMNGSTELLRTQMGTFLSNLFENSMCKSDARRSIIILGLKLVIFPKNQNILNIEFILKT